MTVDRALFVTNMFPSADRPSYGIIVSRMARAMHAKGVEVVVERIHGDRHRADYILANRRVRRVAREFHPDIVHVHFGWSYLAAAGLAVPRVVTFYGDDLHGAVRAEGGESIVSRGGRLISQCAAIRCDRSVAVSEVLRSHIRSRQARARCTVIRDAVDDTLFRPGRRRDAREILGLPPDGVRILFPHSLAQPTKRVDMARAAVEALAARGVAAQLWIVNDAKPDTMPTYYQASDAMIVTSDREGGPSSVKEAMACGIPVVSVPVGDIGTLAAANGPAFIAARDPAALAGALEKAIHAGTGDRRAYLPADLTLSYTSQELLAVYERAIATRATAAPPR